MTIYFGENVKRLRTERGMTQETLADFLGISFQAVSKWERGETYPDISMLPVIASFFNVTVDDLLGVNNIERCKKIDECLSFYEKMRYRDTPLTLKKLEETVRDFPDDFRVLVRYMEILMAEKTIKPSPDYEKASKEIMSIYDKIQNYCTDDSIRLWSKRIICQHLHSKFHITGDEQCKKSVAKILGEMPSMLDTKEYLSTILVSDDDEHRFACSNAIEKELSFLDNTISHYCHYEDRFSPDYKIEAIEKMFKIYDMFFTDGNYGKLWTNVIYNYGHLGRFYFEKNDEENALKYLKLSAEFAKKFDNLPSVTERTSQFFEGTNYEKALLGKPMCERMKIFFTTRYPFSEVFKNSEAFKEIIEILG